MDLRARCDELIAEKGTIGESERLLRLLDVDWEWTMLDQPEFATYAGYLGQNHRWSDRSLEAIDRRKQAARDVGDVVRTFDRPRLGPDDRLNLELFARHTEEAIEGARFRGEFLAIGPQHGPHSFVPDLLRMMPAQTAAHLEDVVARLDALPALLDQIVLLLREGLAAGITIPRVVLHDVDEEIAGHAVDDPASSPLMIPFRKPPPAVDASAAERLRAEAATIVLDKVVPAFRRLHGFFVETYVPGCRETISCTSLPDGEEWYAYLVRRYTTTSLTPKEIHEIGLGEVERIRAEMDRVIERAGFAGTFEEFLEFLRTDSRFFFERAGDLIAAYRDIAKRADPELAKLFGTLPRLPYGVVPVPSYVEKSATTAYYQPGLPDAGRPGYFYANTYDLRSRPKWEMEALTLHEAVPGHHLQIALAQELPGVPEFRRWTFFTAFVEGWGLYAESLGEEMAFYEDPYSKFGQLTYEMWRSIRLVVDTGIHALGWTREQAIDFFRRYAGKAEHDIVVEVDRYISWPGQALAYKIGELKLKELRAHASGALGERFDVRGFHDRVLGAGALPLEVLEARVREWVEQQAR